MTGSPKVLDTLEVAEAMQRWSEARYASHVDRAAIADDLLPQFLATIVHQSRSVRRQEECNRCLRAATKCATGFFNSVSQIYQGMNHRGKVSLYRNQLTSAARDAMPTFMAHLAVALAVLVTDDQDERAKVAHENLVRFIGPEQAATIPAELMDVPPEVN